MTYTLQLNGYVINSSGAAIPPDPNNLDYRTYIAWVAAGNTATPAPPIYVAPSTLEIVSMATNSLNGTYNVGPQDQQFISGEALYIQITTGQGTPRFTNGQATKGWPDTSGALHTFNMTQFISFAETCAQFIDNLTPQIIIAQSGGVPVWPAQPVTIP